MSLRRAFFLLLACFLVLGVRDASAKSGGGGSGGGSGGSGGGTSTGGGSTTAVSGPLTSFSAGAIVIPMDDCYNPDYTANSAPMASTAGCVASAGQTCYAGTTSSGNVRLPFGLIYLLAENNIPVNVILNSTKDSLDSTDFSVTPPSGATTETATLLARSGTSYAVSAGVLTEGTKTMYYWGMPFVVDGPYAAQALAVIAAFSNSNSGYFDSVPIHVINYSFQAPVAAVLGSRPKPVLIDGSALETFFSESGITSVVPNNSSYMLLNGSGSSYTYNWPSAALGANPACPSDLCSGLTWTDSDGVTSRIVDVLWAQSSPINTWSKMPSYYQQGGTSMALGIADSWDSESGGGLGGGIYAPGGGAIKGSFCATMGVSGSNPTATPGPTTYYPASNLYLQLGNLSLSVQGGGGGNSNFEFASNPTSSVAALTQGSTYVAMAGHPTVSGTQQPGELVYFSSINSWHGAAGNKDGGLHIMYNSLIADGNGVSAPMVSTELSRSSPVSQRTGQTYLGTFDWKIPKYPTLGGNSLYQPDKTVYPYTTGHFREYVEPAGTATLACDPTVAGAPCTWDAATHIKAWSSRNIYVGQVSATDATMVSATSTTSSLASDATIQYLASHIGTKLGGIDYSTAAVIEGKGDLSQVIGVTGASTRPTIAYVGARDGMLHAFCAQATCYSTYVAGDELWAFIPPSEKTAMDAARTASDWSSINVGGTIRVGDFDDVFGYPGSTSLNAKGYRTILVMGTRETGAVFALDISNPDPSKVNQDGFRLLWSQDGTYVDSSVTKYTMGKTLGAALGVISTSGGSGYAAVTSAINDSTGASSGENYYLLELSDGKVMQSTQRLYTRRAPLVGGSTGMIPNDVPPLPTIVDVDGDGFDESIVTDDLEGYLRKTVITSALAVDSAHSGVLFDAASGRCGTNLACQPLGATPALSLHGSSNTIGAFVVSGGADWARSATASSYVFGVDLGQPNTTVSTGSPFFSSALGTVTMPAGPAPANQSLAFPLRSYAQPTVAGTDLFVVGTALALNDTTQLSVPSMFPGTYGQVLKYGGLNSTLGTTAFLYISQGTNFGGGMGSVMETNSSSSGGTLTVMGTNQALGVTLASGSSSLANSQYAVQTTSKSGARNFTVDSWFDLSN